MDRSSGVRAESAEAEVVTLRARLAEAEALHWKVGGACSHCSQRSDYAVAWPCETAVALADGVDWDCGQCWVCEVRAAVGRADRAGRPHDCRPIYSRSVCGQCGGQEQWCETCSRQMCGCATDGQEGDHA